jgi:hypothetical protein
MFNAICLELSHQMPLILDALSVFVNHVIALSDELESCQIEEDGQNALSTHHKFLRGQILPSQTWCANSIGFLL